MPSLGKDLATIRDKKGHTLEDIQASTKVPKNILQSIEDDSIFEQLGENTTYTRSYVRSYAKAIGIKEQDIVKALDQQERGNYDGSLAEIKSKAAQDEKPEQSTTTGDKTPSNKLKFSAGKKRSKTSGEKKLGAIKSSDSTKSISSVDWVDVGRKVNPAQSRSTIRAGVLVIVLIIAALAASFFLYKYYYSKPQTETRPANNNAVFEPETPSDSLRESLITEDDRPVTTQPAAPGQQASLADTLSIGIVAANGRLEPVRVYTDILGRRNPYWVQEGDTLRFNFVNTVRIRAVNQYGRLQLLLNGHIIQDFYQQYYNEETGMVELDRSYFEEDPKWRTPVNN